MKTEFPLCSTYRKFTQVEEEEEEHFILVLTINYILELLGIYCV
jgi:hypothetical protein